MQAARRLCHDFLHDDSASTALEYGLIAAAVTLVLVSVMGDMTRAQLWAVLNGVASGFAGMTGG